MNGSGAGGAPAADRFRYDFDVLGPAHHTVLARVPARSTVLEVGCATGYMTRALNEAGCVVTAVDVDEAALARVGDAAHRRIRLDLETERIPEDVEVDVVVCADVLEHLRSPDAVLAQLTSRLRPGGAIVVSLPNIAFWRVRWQLLRGRFDYEETGILDRTHLRFFTLESFSRLARQQGLEVVERHPVSESFPFAWLLRTPLAPLKHKVDGVLRRALPGLFAYQWVLVLRPFRPST